MPRLPSSMLRPQSPFVIDELTHFYPEDAMNGGGPSQAYTLAQPSFAYEPQDMTYFIRECMSEIIDPHVPDDYDEPFNRWIAYMLACMQPELSSIMLALSYYESMFSSERMRVHEVAAADSLLATALILAEKVLRDCPWSNAAWSEVTTIPRRTLRELEELWCEEVGWRVQPFSWQRQMDEWSEDWRAWLEEDVGMDM
ncbi:hypothetical protein B0J12DRAFT_745302 [Macrophomina phaseolina]|uniref:Cyclin N-terminal domain-containing protein n=1 Tax=Macrophomina phaseolina TaxID=35725 RepID=A0ABQ8FVK9_9PEZI|nr:hypothetical protein B0J12DRAFT_745302 [Macrophomina phaseolina]